MQNGWYNDFLLSGLLAFGLLALVQLTTWLVARNQPLEQQRVWRLIFRHVATLILLVGLALIWRTELRAATLALGAAAVGILMAFREAWMSLLAFWLRVVKRHYGLGDFIEIDGVRGMVLDITWQHTVLAETGPGPDSLTYSGRTVQVPNNRMLLSALFVENLTGAYAAHTLQVPVANATDLLAADARLLAVANHHCQPHLADANAHMLSLRRDQALDTPSVEPRVRICFGDKGSPVLVLRFVAPFRDRQRLEQRILRDYLASTLASDNPQAKPKSRPR